MVGLQGKKVKRDHEKKIMRFQGKNRDLTQLSQQIVEELSKQGYKTQSATKPFGMIIQVQPASTRERALLTGDFAYSILITGQPNDFYIHLGIGRWIQNLGVAPADAFFFSLVFLASIQISFPQLPWIWHMEKVMVKVVTEVLGERAQVKTVFF